MCVVTYIFAVTWTHRYLVLSVYVYSDLHYLLIDPATRWRYLCVVIYISSVSRPCHKVALPVLNDLYLRR